MRLKKIAKNYNMVKGLVVLNDNIRIANAFSGYDEVEDRQEIVALEGAKLKDPKSGKATFPITRNHE